MFVGWFPCPEFPTYNLCYRALCLFDMGRSILGTTCSQFDKGGLYAELSRLPWNFEVLFWFCVVTSLFSSALLSLRVHGRILPPTNLSLSSFSTSIMAFDPYTKLNDVSLVVDCGVVWYDHKILGISSNQPPFTFSRLLFRPLNKTLLVDSSWLFV